MSTSFTPHCSTLIEACDGIGKILLVAALEHGVVPRKGLGLEHQRRRTRDAVLVGYRALGEEAERGLEVGENLSHHRLLGLARRLGALVGSLGGIEHDRRVAPHLEQEHIVVGTHGVGLGKNAVLGILVAEADGGRVLDNHVDVVEIGENHLPVVAVLVVEALVWALDTPPREPGCRASPRSSP